MRVLVVITRVHDNPEDGPDTEFGRCLENWRRLTKQETLTNGKLSAILMSLGIDQTIIVVKGSIYCDDDSINSRIRDAVVNIINTNAIPIDEIGVIYHGVDSPANAFRNTYGAKLVFTDYCGTGGLPSSPERKRYLDIESATNQVQLARAFDDAWSFFGSARGIEAKLALLHTCLTPQGRTNSKSEYENVLRFIPNEKREIYKQLYDNISTVNQDCFTPAYVEALSRLRDFLLEKDSLIQDNESV